MHNEIQESWKGFSIHIRAIPVRHIATRSSANDTFIAILKIDRDGTTVADWHLPRFSERWTSAGEAQREAMGYAVKAIDAGCCGEPGTSFELAA
ncbi:hypothetical protein DR64_308 [Paraburkholderia xenovorans LB400]|jgi:hypothetical protein|uniref:Uncharacterized protein n=1 Tax=Paraburkholderia xenovorans (strain LB400) TaxID=266265 RepID=Q13ZX2_PARXL|nr:hypothetical protein [Paraburkholderia xenovorans]ABE30337.1 hypothetical protein Bxe_A4539 [Paraburkholderia xenovorans LB400]ABE30367.1 hypothetical protein Bxe_A2614 [Paraburkholderia xenovorans LB400]AIP33040.1 hypothetical protein DR64_308 [Paraburkholderia xenovorans LB400]